MLQEVRVVAVEHRAVGYGARQIGAEAAVGGHHQFEAGDAPGVVKAHVPFVGEGVALAGDHEVVVAVQAQLDGPAELVRRQRRPHGQVAGLRFLAAKAAAHAPALHAHRVAVDAQRMRHPVLDLSGVLGAGVDQPLPLFLRQGIGDLTLQIEMLLPADFQTPLQAVRRLRQRLGRVAPAYVHGR